MLPPIELLHQDNDDCLIKNCAGPVTDIYMHDASSVGGSRKIVRTCPTHRPAMGAHLRPMGLGELLTLQGKHQDLHSTPLEKAREKGYLFFDRHSNVNFRQTNERLWIEECNRANRTAVIVDEDARTSGNQYRVCWTICMSSVFEVQDHFGTMYQRLQEEKKIFNYFVADLVSPMRRAWATSLEGAEFIAQEVIKLETVLRDPDLLACSMVLDT